MKIVIPGPPIALKRPRFSTITKRVYNSQKAEMNAISFIIKSQYSGPQLTGPLKVTMHFFMEIPNSLSKKKKESINGKPHTKHIDIDNIFKLYSDCITQASNIIVDDSQFAEIYANKVYSNIARTEIEIEELKE